MPNVSISPQPKLQFFDSNGNPLSGGKLYSYDAGTTTPRATYTDSTGSIANANPVILDTRGEASVWLDSSLYKLVLKTASDVSVWTVDNVAGAATLAQLAASGGSALIGFLQAGTGAVTRTAQAKMRDVVSLVDFGGDAGANDNTAAMTAAATYLNSVGGGVILIPYPGEWRMNWVCLYNNITVEGAGGKGEYDLYCIRPYSMASAPITFGDGTTEVRYCSLVNLHISGTDDSVSGQTLAANNAPHTLRLRGGTINFTTNRVVLYNGLKTLSLEPSATQPVVTVRINDSTIRNDITNSASARSIYGIRYADPGYLTDIKFNNTKVNGPTLGFAAEMDGTTAGITFEVVNSYWDIKPDHGVLLKGSSGIVCHDFQLDPGTTGAVIIETDQSTSDPARLINGILRHGGQKFRNSTGTISLPAEADTFSYRQRLTEPYFGSIIYCTQNTDPYSTTAFYDRAGSAASSPMRWNGTDFHFAKDIHIYGGNASAAGYISANSAGGGLYVAALGTNQNIRVLPTGTGYNILGGSGTYPTDDNTQTLGLSGSRWSVVYAGTGTINTSDERSKTQREGGIDPAVLRAWGRVEYSQFKFNDAIQKKGDGARWHFGLIAQRVKDAFEAEGLDAFAYGLLCYDEWGDQYEDVFETVTSVDDQGVEIVERRFTGEKRLARAAGNAYGIRYEEALALECAYLRSRLST